MKISKLIEELSRIKEAQGDIEVTCTGSTLRDGFSAASMSMIRSTGNEPRNLPSDVFETTVENLIVHNDSSNLGHRVRLCL